MQTRIDVVFDSQGRGVSAEIFVCKHCTEDVWVCFIVRGQTHSHFQCVECNSSYCPDGQCPKEQ